MNHREAKTIIDTTYHWYVTLKKYPNFNNEYNNFYRYLLNFKYVGSSIVEAVDYVIPYSDLEDNYGI